MKIDMTPELFKLAQDAMEDSRDREIGRVEFDGHRAAHFIGKVLPDDLVERNMPSDEDIRESIAGAVLANIVRSTRRLPHLKNTLLRNCEMKEVVPEELVELPGKKLVPRSQLYAHEQDFLAAKHRADAKTLAGKAEYESALAVPFGKWRDAELSKGRPASHLTQMTFWLECGHVARIPVAAE